MGRLIPSCKKGLLIRRRRWLFQIVNLNKQNKHLLKQKAKLYLFPERHLSLCSGSGEEKCQYSLIGLITTQEYNMFHYRSEKL